MTQRFGLIGYPLSHSFSRKFFTDKFAKEGIDAQYLNFEIQNVRVLPQIIALDRDLIGLNVTIPYKQQVIRYLDKTDKDAAEIKAVNTIRIIRNGEHYSLEGYNTDIIGFSQSIRPLLQKYHHKALILGSGGASKAIIKVLNDLGIETIIVSRNPQYKGEISYDELDEAVMENYKVIVNTTPIGTFPKVDGCPAIPFELINGQHLLYDLVYNPSESEFMKQGKLRGATVKNGLEMLHLQALASWEIWNR